MNAGEHWRNVTTRDAARWLVVASILLALGLWSVGAFLLWTMRKNDLGKAMLAADNVIATMANDVARNIDMFDLSLNAVIDNSATPGADKLTGELQQQLLFDRAATARYLRSIKVLNQAGYPILDSRTLSPARKSYANRDYFLVHRDNPDTGLYIGHPYFGDGGGYRIGISRRLSHRDGSFAGVVAGIMELDYFKDMFDHVVLSPDSLLALANSDGTLVMRKPLSAGDIGRDMSRSALFRQAQNAASGQFGSEGKRDGVDRVYTFHRVGNYPLVVVMGVSVEDALAGWRRDATAVAAIFAVLGLSTIALALFAGRELRRREAAETRLKILATTDPLTQISNRRGFAATLASEWTEAFATGAAVGLLMIDVDHFKSYNDQNGHQAGDRALIMIGRVLDGARRNRRDLVARYGGEEFAMILPGASLDEAFEIGEAIRRQVGEIADKEALPTVSIGASSLVPSLPDASDILIAVADAALYKAKVDGRNRTAVGGASPIKDAQIAA